VRVAGILIEDDRILLIEHTKNNRKYWLVPGGGVDWGESAAEALIREFKEETSLDIEVEKFLFISEIFMSIPVILITLGIIVLLNNGFHSIILALFVLYMPRTLSYVRGLVKREKHKNYIKIARIYGVSNFRIMRRHIAPNIILPILVNFSTNFAGAILTEASLGYLGFGIQPPYPTLGNMLNESQSYFLLAPWFTILPGLMILFLVYKINQISKKYQEKK